LSRVDLPTLGAPTMATNPLLKSVYASNFINDSTHQTPV
jgi:hypothetical protein